MIELRDLGKVFHASGVETVALKDVNLRVQAGEFVAIVGPSGCGKSTLLNLIGLIDAPSCGEVSIDNTRVDNLSESGRAKARNRHIGFIFQSFNLIGSITIAENVALPLKYRGVSASEQGKLVRAVLERVGLGHRLRHYPSQLSGGQQQRAAIARAIVSRPNLLLADEPTGNLDSEAGKEVAELLTELNAGGATIVMVTHSPEQAKNARRVITMKDGAVASDVR